LITLRRSSRQDSSTAMWVSGFLPGVVGREQIQSRLKGPWRQRLIRLQLLGPVDAALTRGNADGVAVDDLHGNGATATGTVVMTDGASRFGLEAAPASPNSWTGLLAEPSLCTSPALLRLPRHGVSVLRTLVGRAESTGSARPSQAYGCRRDSACTGGKRQPRNDNPRHRNHADPPFFLCL
jgi:hypothetical protein